MITFVDTNVLLDVFGMDPVFCESSANALRVGSQEGVLKACEVVWAEVSSRFVDQDRFKEVMNQLGIEFSPIDQESARVAGVFWQEYLNAGGHKKDRIVADFLIGAHAKNHGDRLLTRDRDFFRSYFKGLIVFEPHFPS